MTPSLLDGEPAKTPKSKIRKALEAGEAGSV